MLIDVKNVSKRFPKADKDAVADLSFSLNDGEILALLGGNGAGKTTTIKMLLGLITPSGGSIEICGHDVLQNKPRQLAMKRIGAVLEGARNAYWRLSARDNLIYFGSLRGLSRKELRPRIDELLSFLDLTESADKEVRHYSRGMQQKLAIALALIHEPDVLLLDEPTLGLDVQSARLLEQRVAQLAEQGKGIILTTHTMPLAQSLASTILVINKGQRVAYGAKDDLLQQFNTQTVVEVEVEGAISAEFQQSLTQQFPKLTINPNGSATHLAWADAPQRQIVSLYDVLDKNGLQVKAVQQRQADLEEVFLSLTKTGEAA